MDVKSPIDARRFSPERLAKTTLFESARMFCDVYGLAPGQEQKPHVHPDGDKLYYVIEGHGHFTVGADVREVGERHLVCVPAGVEHAVRNASVAPLTLLVVMAPHPTHGSTRASRS